MDFYQFSKISASDEFTFYIVLLHCLLFAQINFSSCTVLYDTYVARYKYSYIEGNPGTCSTISLHKCFCFSCPIVANRRLNMELDLQSLFGLHVHSCTLWLRPHNPPPEFIWAPCAQLYSLAETPQPPSPPPIWAHVRGRYWSAKTTSLCDPMIDLTTPSPAVICTCISGVQIRITCESHRGICGEDPGFTSLRLFLYGLHMPAVCP